MAVCIIGARGGSKGLSGKNVKEILGKPLIVWSIEQALACPDISSVYVSTDSEHIASVARMAGAKVPKLRPAEYASDNAGKWQVWQHFVNEIMPDDGDNDEFIIDLDCTSPLRDVVDISKAVELYKSSDVDAVFSVCEARKNPYFNMVEYNGDHLEICKKLPGRIVRRQDAPAVYEHVASIYVLNINYVRTGDNLLSGKTIGYDIGYEKSFDIDSELDFEIVQFFMNKKR